MPLLRGAPVRRRVRLAAQRAKGEPLTPEDWAVFFELADRTRRASASAASCGALPVASPRCGICGAPFAGVGARLVRPLGYRPSRKSPNLCADLRRGLAARRDDDARSASCFADIRGFTSLSERSDPAAVSALLRRFYAAAEDVLFPEAVIDKLIGDEVMALLPTLRRRFEEAAPADARARPAAARRGRLRRRRGRRSPRSASASTTARPSSATSAATPTPSSPRSATSST